MLIDERFTWGAMRGSVSRWLRDRIKQYSKFNELETELSGFFDKMKAKDFKPKVEQLAQVNLEDEEGDGKVSK